MKGAVRYASYCAGSCICVFACLEYYPWLLLKSRGATPFSIQACLLSSPLPMSRNLKNVSTLMSFYSEEGSIGNRSGPNWPQLAMASYENQLAFARLSGIRYVRATTGHRRCGKLRHVLKELLSLPVGDWLFFLDADVAVRACGEPMPDLSTYIAKWHRSVYLYELRDVDMLIITKFGIFAVRNSEWSRDYLERLAAAVESRRVLCESTLPENYAFHAVTTESDYCHMHDANAIPLGMRPSRLRRGRTFLHISGSGAKENVSFVSAFVRQIKLETSCLQGEHGDERQPSAMQMQLEKVFVGEPCGITYKCSKYAGFR